MARSGYYRPPQHYELTIFTDVFVRKIYLFRKMYRDSKARIKRKAGKFNRLYATVAINLDALRASFYFWLGHA